MSGTTGRVRLERSRRHQGGATARARGAHEQDAHGQTREFGDSGESGELRVARLAGIHDSHGG
jgi:hypothetical protein